MIIVIRDFEMKCYWYIIIIRNLFNNILIYIYNDHIQLKETIISV